MIEPATTATTPARLVDRVLLLFFGSKPTDDEISARLLLTLATTHENLGNIHAAVNALQLALLSVPQDQAGSLGIRIRSRLKRLTAETVAQ